MKAEEILVKNGVFIKPEVCNFNIDLTRDAHTGTQEKIIQSMIEFTSQEIEKISTPKWIVNSMGELGVEINNRQFFLYMGDNIEYNKPGEDPDDIQYRSVGKREFGEVCHPVDWYDEKGICQFQEGYKEELVNPFGELDDEDKWKPLPKKQ